MLLPLAARPDRPPGKLVVGRERRFGRGQHGLGVDPFERRARHAEAPQNEAGWARLLDRCDLLVAPYDLEQYAICCSGMVLEGLANAIPVVLAEDSASTRVLRRFGMPGATFKRVDAESVVAATEAAFAAYDELAGRAAVASRQWQEQQGPVRMVESLMAMLPAGQRNAA